MNRIGTVCFAAICSFIVAQYAARTAIETPMGSPFAIAAKASVIMVVVAIALMAAYSMLRAIRKNRWLCALTQGGIAVGSSFAVLAIKFLWVV